jgi:hypothetical protein
MVDPLLGQMIGKEHTPTFENSEKHKNLSDNPWGIIQEVNKKTKIYLPSHICQETTSCDNCMVVVIELYVKGSHCREFIRALF